MATTYKDAGVDIEKTNKAINSTKNTIQTTFNDNVLSTIGGFGACFELTSTIQSMHQPVMVQSIDGVGSKTQLARHLNDFSGLGHDLLSACCNDIAVMGAKPVTFIDYIASEAIEPQIFQTIIESLAQACRATNVALIGGETAEMPTIYRPNEIDLVGAVFGVIDKASIINGQSVKPGDKVYGIASSGLHTNGYTLVQHLLADADYNQVLFEDDNRTLGQILLEPHTNYTQLIQTLLAQNAPISGMAHITGGGLADNIARVLPENCGAVISIQNWQVPPIFTYLQNLGDMSFEQASKTFNMGIGMVVIGPESLGQLLTQTAGAHNVFTVGDIVDGKQDVNFIT